MTKKTLLVVLFMSLLSSTPSVATNDWRMYGLVSTASLAATLTVFNFVEFIRIATGPGSEFTKFRCENTNSCDFQIAFGLQIGAFVAQGLTAIFTLLSAFGDISHPALFEFERLESGKKYFFCIILLSAVPPILNGFTALPLKEDRATSEENAIVRSYKIAAYVQAALASTIPVWLSFIFVASLRKAT